MTQRKKDYWSFQESKYTPSNEKCRIGHVHRYSHSNVIWLRNIC